jgi:hypothetical protein
MDEIVKERKQLEEEIQQSMEDIKKERMELEEERADWIEEQKMVQNMMTDELFHFNVGGLYFPTVSKAVLTSIPNTGLGAMFSGKHVLKYQADGKIFIDRDPKMFEYLLKFIRNGGYMFDLDSKYDNQNF